MTSLRRASQILPPSRFLSMKFTNFLDNVKNSIDIFNTKKLDFYEPILFYSISRVRTQTEVSRSSLLHSFNLIVSSRIEK
jgi:hypothetical protein